MRSTSCSSNIDQRSIFYLTLLVVIYCCVLIRASSATSAAVHERTSATTDSTAATTTVADIFNAAADTHVSSNNNNSTSTTTQSAFLVKAATDGDDDAAADGVDDNNDNVQLVVVRHYSDEANPLYLHRASRDAANVPDDDDDSSYHDDEFDEYEALIHNKSAKGKYIGAPCDNFKCEPALMHVSCDRETELCSCQKNYPVQLGLTKGCAKPKKLGEQCFYDKTCVYNDENSQCVQVKHNALCQCASGFHSVSYSKPTRRVFCTQDLKELKSDLPTLLGVSTGIAVLAGLICMVLHLFSKTKYPRHRNFGDANLPPPIMYSSETGSRRPSLASVHSTSSSVRSYSMMRFEKETQQKEIRQEMKLRLARLHQQQHMSQNKPQIVIGDTLLHHHGALARISMSTPSPLTPNSLDELLPSVDETQEFPSKSEQPPTPAMAKRSTPTVAAYNGPCSSSTEAL